MKFPKIQLVVKRDEGFVPSFTIDKWYNWNPRGLKFQIPKEVSLPAYLYVSPLAYSIHG